MAFLIPKDAPPIRLLLTGFRHGRSLPRVEVFSVVARGEHERGNSRIDQRRRS
jgi:hypothetical protein